MATMFNRLSYNVNRYFRYFCWLFWLKTSLNHINKVIIYVGFIISYVYPKKVVKFGSDTF